LCGLVAMASGEENQHKKTPNGQKQSQKNMNNIFKGEY